MEIGGQAILIRPFHLGNVAGSNTLTVSRLLVGQSRISICDVLKWLLAVGHL